MDKQRHIRFSEIFPKDIDFFSWLINLNTVSHALQAVDYNSAISIDSPEINNAVSQFLIFVCREHLVLEKALELLKEEIDYYDGKKKELYNEDN